ncbi:STAS domain-containing protein [Streptomyces sp. NPDC046759]|uniref:STAS domain-containing protein n=1 Tax=Streptomyces sp. NPDC046759 TaxID=3155019 RepID=UPI0033C7F014
MTEHRPVEFDVEITGEPSRWTVHIAGELDYDTSDDLVDTVVRHLRRHPEPGRIRLDFRSLTWIDSSGLSALLMIHRRTSALGADLCLDNRPDFLDQRLRLTDILGYLTRPAAAADARGTETEGDATTAGAT